MNLRFLNFSQVSKATLRAREKETPGIHTGTAKQIVPHGIKIVATQPLILFNQVPVVLKVRLMRIRI